MEDVNIQIYLAHYLTKYKVLGHEFSVHSHSAALYLVIVYTRNNQENVLLSLKTTIANREALFIDPNCFYRPLTHRTQF